jgi:hypothetical protein
MVESALRGRRWPKKDCNKEDVDRSRFLATKQVAEPGRSDCTNEFAVLQKDTLPFEKSLIDYSF